MNKKIELDFNDIIIASTSFFDEGIAKLIDEGFDSEKLKSIVTITNINPNDKEVLKQVCKYRGLEII